LLLLAAPPCTSQHRRQCCHGPCTLSPPVTVGRNSSSEVWDHWMRQHVAGNALMALILLSHLQSQQSQAE
jgi:hypothetical protein